MLHVDGTRPISAELIEAVQVLCDRAEDHELPGGVVIGLSGAPDGPAPGDLNIGLVSKWERALRRLERLPMTTFAAVTGDCGGTALEVLLATDVRIATPGTRLIVGTHGNATWPGMALYRLTQQGGVAGVRRAVLLGTPIDAESALALGLVNELADDPAAALGERTTDLSGREVAIRRQLMFDATRTSFEDALGTHLAACDRALRRSAAS
jgi:isomerase DpgB